VRESAGNSPLEIRDEEYLEDIRIQRKRKSERERESREQLCVCVCVDGVKTTYGSERGDNGVTA
jgi:hypothetical protein